MLAKKEVRFCTGGQVWTGIYKNLHNIPHWHTEHELTVCLEGTAQITLDGDAYTLEAGQCCFCRSGCVHWISADEACILLVCIFDEALTRSITSGFRLSKPVFADRYGLAAQLKALHGEASRNLPFQEEASRAKIALMMISVFRGEQPVPIQPEEKPTSRRCMQLLDKVDREYEFITFAEAARFMNFTESYFSCYFKQHVGVPFSKYLSTIRVKKALTLIRQNPKITVAEAAARSGFNSVRSLDRTVKELTGYSPKKLPPDFPLDKLTGRSAQEVFDPTLQNSQPL